MSRIFMKIVKENFLNSTNVNILIVFEEESIMSQIVEKFLRMCYYYPYY